jgi:putative Mg2+ transporter-C (MgtC) family protein
MGAHLNDTRIPSYVVVGIGFLGAGAIVRRGNSAGGLTTAASIWMVAAIGLAMGYANSFGLYVALVATAITLIALGISDANLMNWLHVPRKHTIRVTCTPSDTRAEQIEQIIHDAKIRIDESDVDKIYTQDGFEVMELVYAVDLPHGKNLGGVVRDIGALSGVRAVEANEPPFAAP